MFWLAVSEPDAFVAKMERFAGSGIGDEAVLAWLDEAEKIVRERHGADMAKFFAALRNRVVHRGKGGGEG